MLVTPEKKQTITKWFVRSLTLLSMLVVLFACTIALIDRMISWQTQSSIYHDIANVPHYEVGLVLGTSKYIGHTLNTYYSHRIDAAIELHKQGKVHSFLLSGDNAHRSYNEPWTMKRDLLKAGIQEQNIHLDYAGFRTLDSIIRAKEIFLANHFLIITQDFHCERALYIARYHHINAQCLAVPGPLNTSGLNIRIREVFARTKAFLDLYVLHAQPKFLGPIKPILTDEESPTEIVITPTSA
ncbi:SanA/YdcF family protein [Vibrio aphrogenes]|uniref:SanA/YdcF family protein n=1 Tax=Vibrio aphrogenes TaxID=1891186 RepID=UPI002F93EF88